MTSINEDMTKDNYKSYGNNALVESAKHYNNFMTSHDEVLEEKELIDLSDVISEWKTLLSYYRNKLVNPFNEFLYFENG